MFGVVRNFEDVKFQVWQIWLNFKANSRFSMFESKNPSIFPTLNKNLSNSRFSRFQCSCRNPVEISVKVPPKENVRKQQGGPYKLFFNINCYTKQAVPSLFMVIVV